MLVNLINQEEWDKYFIKASLKNICQDWNYAIAKAQINNLKIYRYKVVLDYNVIAIFQVYSKSIKFLPIIDFLYLNRGPIFIEEPSPDIIYKVFKLIKDKFRLRNRKILLLNPFIENTAQNIQVLKKLNFIQFKKRKYTTSYIDLTYSESELRNTLNSKWRNQLSLSEKKGLFLKINNSDFEIEPYIRKYILMLANKKFTGISEKEIRLLHKTLAPTHQFIILDALDSENNLVGFTVILTYGDQAIYLIGWIDNNFRNLNPSNFLLWNSIKYLKINGYNLFDLGGLDEINLPGISKFKKGMSGKLINYSEQWINF